MDYMLLTPIGAIVAIAFTIIQYYRLKKYSPGSEDMIRIQRAIRIGAKTYLKRQYLGVYLSAGVIFLLLFILAALGMITYFIPFAFIWGLTTCAFAGVVGMMASTYANSRTAEACKTSINDGLKVAYSAGSIMGLGVVGIVLFEKAFWYILLKYIFVYQGGDLIVITDILLMGAIGTSYMAFFARVGGGVYTKGADVGADLVGKVELNIPEDDPRNAAVIADAVGDNVGDVAGMGADLHETYATSILVSMTLGASAFFFIGATAQQILNATAVAPLIMVSGVIASVIGSFLVKTNKEKPSHKDLMWALNRGLYTTMILTIIASFFIIWGLIGWEYIRLFFGFLLGLLSGVVIGLTSEYFTSDSYKPTIEVGESAKWGVAPVIIKGLSVGMGSVGPPIIMVVLSSFGAYVIGAKGFGPGSEPLMGLFCIGLTAVGMLSILGISLSTDAYGPVSDNAAGIATMAKLDPIVRERTDALDSIGNTTAAIGKGFVIGSGALTVLAMIAAYTDMVEKLGEMPYLAITDIRVIAGLFIGGMMPFIFSALTSGAVATAAGKVVQEVRRQFKEIPGLKEGDAEADYEKVVKISVAAGQKSMITPGLLTIIVPVAVGMLLGVQGAIALLVGSLVSGFAVALFFANAGATWDNAKKRAEAMGLKGTDIHKALVVGDTVGDPLKDTSGPSLDGLIKLMTTVSIVVVVLVYKYNLFELIG